MEACMIELTTHLSQCLFHQNPEIVLETARVLGNLTRSEAVRRSLLQSRADEALVLLLGHAQADVLAAVTGVLVNVSADPLCRSSLLRPSSNLLSAFSDLLRKASFKDIALSTLICQALHNLLSPAPPQAWGIEGGGDRFRDGDRDRDGNGYGDKDGDSDRYTPSITLIHEALLELAECASDLKTPSEADPYAGFERVACAVMGLIDKRGGGF
mmetsp:Transcript_19900/g.44321  ORF Transcript_19900/g.44321 Transcript_19900/m.44321 type:complete len:213 (-) Transcript_19900:76-714(-)